MLILWVKAITDKYLAEKLNIQQLQKSARNQNINSELHSWRRNQQKMEAWNYRDNT